MPDVGCFFSRRLHARFGAAVRGAAMTARLKPGNITQFAMDETVSVVGLHASFGPEVVSRCCAGQLFCTQCATNLAFRMGPGAPDLDPVASDLEVVDRVAAGAYIDTDAHTHVCTQSMYMLMHVSVHISVHLSARMPMHRSEAARYGRAQWEE